MQVNSVAVDRFWFWTGSCVSAGRTYTSSRLANNQQCVHRTADRIGFSVLFLRFEMAFGQTCKCNRLDPRLLMRVYLATHLILC